MKSSVKSRSEYFPVNMPALKWKYPQFIIISIHGSSLLNRQITQNLHNHSSLIISILPNFPIIISLQSKCWQIWSHNSIQMVAILVWLTYIITELAELGLSLVLLTKSECWKLTHKNSNQNHHLCLILI